MKVTSLERSIGEMFFFCWIKDLSAHLCHCRAMGCRIGVTVVLGEMDVARVNPYRFGQGQPPLLSAWFQARRPKAVTQFRGRLDVFLLADGRRPPGPDYIGRWGTGDKVWENKKTNQLKRCLTYQGCCRLETIALCIRRLACCYWTNNGHVVIN